MTSIDFLNKVHKSLDSQEYSLSYSPAKSKNYMLYCNGNFIGGLFDEELCFVYADSVSELLGQPEPVYRGYRRSERCRTPPAPDQRQRFWLLHRDERPETSFSACGRDDTDFCRSIGQNRCIPIDPPLCKTGPSEKSPHNIRARRQTA